MKIPQMPLMPYVSKRGYQPICVGVDDSGELIWDLRPKEPWHQKMFPVHYEGDMGEQWIYLSAYQKGYEWAD